MQRETVAGKRRTEKSLWKLLGIVVLNGLVFNFFLVVLNGNLIRRGLSVPPKNVLSSSISFLKGEQGADSLPAMLSAIHFLQGHRDGSVYDAVFFQDQTKFQYPLTSLLPYYALVKMGVGDQDLYLITKGVTWISTCTCILLAAGMALVLSDRTRKAERDWHDSAIIAVAVGVGGLLFYPLMKGFQLGQIQIILTLGFSIAFCCWMAGFEKSAGAVMGLMALVKPQYGLFLLWSLMRKKWGAFASGVSCAISGVLISLGVFGWQNNLDYLRVLRFISRHGESFAPNQSMNGLLNRLLFNGNNLVWDSVGFAPYHPIVYYGTLVSSLAIIAFALFYRWGAERCGGVADFAFLALAATVASPVAWEHHYAIVLPILVWLWFREYPLRFEYPLLMGLAFVLTSDNIAPLGALASVPVLNIFQSYIYFGGLIVLFLLVRSRATVELTPERVP